MSRKKSAGTGAGAPWRRNSDESVSPRCVLDDGYTTSSNSSGTMGTSSAGAATTTFPAATATTTYGADGAASGRQDGPPPWKAVAEAWRSRAKRQLSGRILMESSPQSHSHSCRTEVEDKQCTCTTMATNAPAATQPVCWHFD